MGLNPGHLLKLFYFKKKEEKKRPADQKRLVRNEQIDISTKMSKRSKFEAQHSTDLTMR